MNPRIKNLLDKKLFIGVALVIGAMIALAFGLPASLIPEETNLVVITAFFSSFTFLVLYSALVNWWEKPIGWTLVILDSGLFLTLLPAVLHLLFSLSITGSLFFARYYVISVALVATGVIWRTWVMCKVNFVEKIKEVLKHDKSAEIQDSYKEEEQGKVYCES